jgi:hypothetical protein
MNKINKKNTNTQFENMKRKKKTSKCNDNDTKRHNTTKEKHDKYGKEQTNRESMQWATKEDTMFLTHDQSELRSDQKDYRRRRSPQWKHLSQPLQASQEQ